MAENAGQSTADKEKAGGSGNEIPQKDTENPMDEAVMQYGSLNEMVTERRILLRISKRQLHFIGLTMWKEGFENLNLMGHSGNIMDMESLGELGEWQDQIT